MRSQSIRQLRPGEPVPAGIPKRYKNQAGYIRLRWRLGRAEYVECYEHRLVAGLPEGQHVHHRNKRKADNAPTNLEVIDIAEHARRHSPITWNVDEASDLYLRGWSLPRLSRKYGVHFVTISRAFKSRGIARRSSGEWKKQPVNYEIVQELYRRGMRLGAMSRYLGIGREVLERVRVELGLAPFPVGRPAGVRPVPRDVRIIAERRKYMTTNDGADSDH